MYSADVLSIFEEARVALCGLLLFSIHEINIALNKNVFVP